VGASCQPVWHYLANLNLQNAQLKGGVQGGPVHTALATRNQSADHGSVTFS
jgi:hypothetical protein